MSEDTKASLNDLPNEILVDLFKYLDLTETFKLRLNKRLDQLQLSTRHLIKSMIIQVNGSYSSFNFCMGKKLINNSKPLEAGSFNFALRRLARNTHVEWAHLHVEAKNENQDDVSQCIDAMFNFHPEFMGINVNKVIALPEITFSQLLDLAQRTNRVEIEANFSSITAENLCQLRQLMLDGICAMKTFTMRVDQRMAHSFLKACFGVTIVDTRDSRLYHAENESFEMFPLFGNPRQTEFNIFEGTVCTKISDRNSMIRFTTDTSKPLFRKVLWNHRYK